MPLPAPQPPTPGPEYQLGFDAGYRYAITPRSTKKVSSERKFYAFVTLAIGLGSSAAVIATTTNSKWRYGFAAFGVAGALLSTMLAVTRILDGGPAPWER